MADGSVVDTWDALVPANWTAHVSESETEATRPPAGSLEGLDDAQLVAATLNGRRDAFDVLVLRHRRAVYQVCYRFSGRHEDAGDLAQEAFLRAWRGLRHFRGQSAFRTWLYRIAVNACLNRSGSRTSGAEPLDPERLVDDRADARTELLRHERAAAVRKAIAALPQKQRATLILRAYHDLPHQEIANILGSSVGAVKANFFHALVNLKKLLGREP